MRLRWVLRAIGHHRTGQSPSWETIRSIALVLSARNQPAKDIIDRFIEKTGKYVEVFYVEAESRKPTYADWRCLTRTDADAWKLPGKKIRQEIRKKHFDLVVNAAPARDRFALLLGAMIPAGMLCSGSSRFREADLVISSAGTNNMEHYLNEVLRYLQMIRV